MRWIPLQNINSRKWVLCVLYDDCMSYDVTLIESEHVERILSYASYMNDGVTDNIDPATLVRLQKLKKRIIDKHSD
ncbi:hypothetical protein D7V83_02675 [bacterium 0.1xD8-71]|nr:hypothetical protein D7V83_02675 [bacterium 0.1xD8-71]